jgi:hypothetical protein
MDSTVPMSDDIKNMLDKLRLLEGTVTSSALPKRGLNKQQKSVPELPALFKPKDISPVLGGKKDPRHPTADYFVGGESKEMSEDLLSNVRRTLDDYLQDIEQKLEKQKDRDLISKAGQDIQKDPLRDLLPVKTIATDDGKDMRIHGNENDGFVIRIRDRPMKARFRTLDEAEMACELFAAHRRNRNMEAQAQDYVEES